MATATIPVFSVDEFELTSNEFDPNYMRETFIDTTEDLLLIACTLFRLTQENREKYSCFSLDGDARTIVNMITQNDRVFAEKVRNEFASKIVMYVMKVGVLSKFKQDVNTYLTSNFKISPNEYSTPTKFIGLCYKLPYFYDYDQRQLKLFENHSKQVVGMDKFKDTLQVKFLAKLETKTRKSSNKIEYWFEDEDQNRITVDMDKNNPLIAFLDGSLDKPLNLSANFSKRIHYNVEYYVTSHWKLSL